MPAIYNHPQANEAMRRIHEQLNEIGQKNPQRAAHLSHKVLNCNWFHWEVQKLEAEGLVIDDCLINPGLKGGMMNQPFLGGANKAGGIATEAIIYAIKILYSGNEDEATKTANAHKNPVPAEFMLPHNKVVKGRHFGPREISQNPTTYKCSLCCLRCRPHFEIHAYGDGKFLSEEGIQYVGAFVNNECHDLTGKAVLQMSGSERYTGCIQNGERDGGFGKLEIFSKELNGWYTHCSGTWRHDKLYDGNEYDIHGQLTRVLRKGVATRAATGQGGATNTAAGQGGAQPPRRPQPDAQLPQQQPQRHPEPRPMAVERATAPQPKWESVDHSEAGMPDERGTTFNAPNLPAPKMAARHQGPRRVESLDHYELFHRKLKDPSLQLSTEQSIELLTQCIAFGRTQVETIDGTESVILIGNTGAGKSTLGNALCGCQFKLVSFNELGIAGLGKAVVVKGRHEGGPVDEIMQIGHSKQSMTCIPQIVKVNKKKYTLADCPGFLDNRGPEINIANAVNIREALRRAEGVKVVMLINYHSLLADRGRGLTEMLKIASHLFGSYDNLVKNKNSILIGITNVPLEDISLAEIQAFIAEDPIPIMATLAERLFIYDPLDRSVEGSVSINTLRKKIEGLRPIANPGRIFSTVLTDEDEVKLIQISDQIAERIKSAMEQSHFEEAAAHLDNLQSLDAIAHARVTSIIAANRLIIERYFRNAADEFKSSCHFENFEEAQSQYNKLSEAVSHFDQKMQSVVDMGKLHLHYTYSVKKARKAHERQEELRKQVAAAQNKHDEVVRLLKEQQEKMKRDFESQAAEHKRAQEEIRLSFAQKIDEATEEHRRLMNAKEKAIEEKTKELQLASRQDQERMRQQNEEERRAIEAKYEKQIGEITSVRQKYEEDRRLREEKFAKEQAADQERFNAQMARLTSEIRSSLASSSNLGRGTRAGANAPRSDRLF